MNAQSEHDKRTMMCYAVYAKIVHMNTKAIPADGKPWLTADDLAFLRWALGITLI